MRPRQDEREVRALLTQLEGFAQSLDREQEPSENELKAMQTLCGALAPDATEGTKPSRPRTWPRVAAIALAAASVLALVVLFGRDGDETSHRFGDVQTVDEAGWRTEFSIDDLVLHIACRGGEPNEPILICARPQGMMSGWPWLSPARLDDAGQLEGSWALPKEAASVEFFVVDVLPP